MTHSKQNKLGFTLVEMVIVITILGIIAAFAIPRLANITGDAQTATTNGVAGALAAAAAENFAARTENPKIGASITNCTDVSKILQGGTMPTGYAIKPLVIAANSTSTCVLTGPGNSTATFPAAGIR